MNFDPSAVQGSPNLRSPRLELQNSKINFKISIKVVALGNKCTGNSTSFMLFSQVYVNFTELIHRQVVRVKTWFDFYLMIVIKG